MQIMFVSNKFRAAIGSVFVTASTLAISLCVTPAAAQVVAITDGGLNANGKNTTTSVDANGNVYVVNGPSSSLGLFPHAAGVDLRLDNLSIEVAPDKNEPRR